MLKRLIAVVLLSFFVSVSYASENDNKSDESFNEDYFVGLKAFDDGFYDVSRESFKDYLANDDKSPRAGFAFYLLYQIYMAENDFKNAQDTLNRLENFSDKRFDTKKMQADKMYISTKISCTEAETLLLSATNDIWFKVYLESECTVSEPVINHALNGGFSDDVLYTLIDSSKDDKNLMTSIYAGLPDNKKTSKVLNYFGKYFASGNMFTEFWDLYNNYKDKDMAAIALDYTWNEKNYPKYINIFNSDVKEDYDLPNTVYCRMIEASNKSGNIFDCNIIDGCLGKSNPDFIKSKLACYMKNEDKNGINNFMKDVPSENAEKLCEYAKYMVSKNIYTPDFLDKFSGCSDKDVMYETLYNSGDSLGLIKLIGNSSAQIDYAYLSVAYAMAGKETAALDILQKITEPQFIEMVQIRTGLKK